MGNKQKHFVVHKFVRITLQQLEEELFRCDKLFSLVFNNDLKGFKNHVLGLSSEHLYVRDRDGWSLLHYAVLVNAGDIVSYLIEAGFDPNLPCEARAFGVSGWRAIHIAAEMGNDQLLDKLLKLGANPEMYIHVEQTYPVQYGHNHTVNKTKKDSWNALHLAVYSHSASSVRTLLKAGVYPESRTLQTRRTPLIIAAKHGNLTALTLLLEQSMVDVCAEDSGGPTAHPHLTALHYAARRTPKGVDLLLQSGADSSQCKTNLLPIHMAAAYGTKRIIEILLESDSSVMEKEVDSMEVPPSSGNKSKLLRATPLVIAMVHNQSQSLQFLLSQGANINHLFNLGNVNNMNVVRFATEQRSHGLDHKMLDLVLNNGADINNIASDGMSPLLRAASRNLAPVVTKLCQFHPQPDIRDSSGYTALMWSVKWKNVSMVTAILALKPHLEMPITFADARKNKYYNCTPLQMAVGKGHLELTRMLLEHGANIHTTMDSMGPDQDECQVSCLHTAVVMDHVHIGELLLQRGISPHVTTSSLLTPLHYAASWGHTRFASLLLENKCAVDPVGEQLRATPLIYAARRNKHETMKLLLENGADPNHQDKQGYTALHWSLTFDHQFSIDCLLDERWKLDLNLRSEKVEHRGHVTSLVLALEYSSLPVVERLLRRGSDPNVRFEANEMTLTPIFLSAEFGAVDKMKCLMRYGAQINCQSSRGETPLHFALRFEKLDAARLLISNGARFDQRATIGNGEHQQAVHVAAQLGQHEVIQNLVERGAAVNSTMVLKSVERVTALHLAALNDLTSTVKKLIQLGADVNCQRSDTFTPLLTAVSKANFFSVKHLVKNGAQVNTRCIVSRSKDATCLHIAAQVGSLEIVNLLLDSGADVTARMTTGDRTGILPIHLAAESGHLEVIRQFVEIGVPVNTAEDCGLTCLHYAANGGKLDIVRYLLQAGADVAAVATFDDNNRVHVLPVHMACEKGHTECARELLEHNSPRDSVMSRNRRGGITPLYLAVAENHVDTAAMMIDVDADVTVQDGIGAAPLHIACQRGYLDLFHVLLATENSSKQCLLATHNGVTPLHIAAEKGHTEMVTWLLRLAPQVVNFTCSIEDVHSKQTSKLITPLHQACGFGHEGIVRLLLAHGADVLSGEVFEGREGVTPVHAAAIRGRREVLQCLHEHRCSLDVQDVVGWTPLHWAAKECFYDTVDLLLKLGADPSIQNYDSELPENIALTNDISGLLKSSRQIIL